MFDIVLSALRAFFTWAMPKIAVFFGVYVLSTNVTKPIFERFQHLLEQQLGQAGQFVQVFELIGVNDFISIIFSAYALAFSLKASKAALSKAS